MKKKEIRVDTYCKYFIMLDGIKNFLNSKFTPSDKDFEAKGVLSAEQFIQAGDQLTNFGWKWQKSLHLKNKYLSNPEKQYLVSPASSANRIKKLTDQQIDEKKGEEGFL
jgi:hypothetical protein